MDWYHGVRRAYEIDLEEIRIMAEVAATAPPYVAHRMLMILMEEVMEAMHWHMMLMMRPGYIKPPFDYDYDYDKPQYGAPYTAEEKQEEDK